MKLTNLYDRIACCPGTCARDRHAQEKFSPVPPPLGRWYFYLLRFRHTKIVANNLTIAATFAWAVGLANCEPGFGSNEPPAAIIMHASQVPSSPISIKVEKPAPKKRKSDTESEDLESVVEKPAPSPAPAAVAPSPQSQPPSGRTFTWSSPLKEAAAASGVVNPNAITNVPIQVRGCW
jgi:hypothetical protein